MNSFSRKFLVVPEHPRQPRQAGFALLITITLLAFLVLLLVSLASLTRVETQVAANTQQLASARQNALMALNIALGQLQQAAGPDQRVTARAEILDTGSTTLRSKTTTPAAAVYQPLWTGVWKTGSAGLDVNPSGTPQRQTSLGSLTPTVAEKVANATAWLVSTPTPGVANASIDPRTYTGTTTGASPDAVTLATNVGPSQNVSVTVPLVDLKATPAGFTTPQPVGGYGYWVSDEGIKARVNLPANAASSAPGSDIAQNQRHYISPATVATEKSFDNSPSNAPYRSAWTGSDTTSHSKLTTPNALGFVVGASFNTAATGLKTSLPDITTYSYGVLADVRNGGLKKDLTAAFENQSQFTTLAGRYTKPGDDGMGMKLWRSTTTPALAQGYYLDGPRWASLFYFYNLYKSSMPALRAVGSATAVTPKGIGTPSVSPSVEAREYRLNSGSNYMLMDPIAPRFLAMKLEIGISSEDVGGGNYQLRLHYFPELVLYNPYNVTITASPGRALQYVLESNTFNQDGCTITKTSGTSTVLYSSNLTYNSSISLATDGTDATFAPGEVRVFGLAASAPVSANPWVMGMPGNNQTHSLSRNYLEMTNLNYPMPVTTATGGPATPPTLTGSDTIQIKIPKRIRANRFHLYAIGINSWPDAVSSTSSQPLHNGTIDYSTVLATSASNAQVNIFGPTAGVRVDSLAVAGAGGAIQRIGALIIRVKGSSPFADPKAPALAPAGSLLNILDMSRSNAIFDVSNRTGTGFTSAEEIPITPTGNATWGKFDVGRDPNDPTARVLRELPVQPMTSLGQFTHLTLGYNVGGFNGEDFGGSPVGNSLPDVMIPATATSTLSGALFTDDNYLNNEALFDTFFFSTLPPDLASTPLPAGTTIPAGWSGFNQASVDVGTALLNPRHTFARTSTGASPAISDLRDMDKAATGILVNGAFNVNSTSVPAWRALLASLRFTTQSNANPMPRYTSQLTTVPTADDYPKGVRVLTDTQLDALATAVVQQVKTRGPFLSMADFINRRLSNDPALGQRGALQAAIDSSGINTAAQSALGSGSNMTFVYPPGYPTVVAANIPANAAIGAPGFIMQADILQALAPVLTARSDTFVIRTYGETRNPATSEVSGRAWAEAVVQRIPEYVDSAATAAHLIPASGSNNETFGRRFKVVSFRWLTPNDL